MRRLYLLCLILLGPLLTCRAHNTVSVDLTIRPENQTFACRYELGASFGQARGSCTFNLNRKFRLAQASSPHLRDYTATPFFDAFQQDTLLRITLRFESPVRHEKITLRYGGAIPERFRTDSLAEFTASANWLPNLPDHEYDLVRYQLTVHTPAGYEVISTNEPRRARAGTFVFAGLAPNIELTAVAARRFTRLRAPQGVVRVYKANGAPHHRDSLLLRDATAIVAYHNRIIGRQDPIRRFRILLPGTNRNAFGLLDNCAVITYSDFDTRKPADLLILAHEISHKWWGWGRWNTRENWLNEGFAAYSGLLYLRAAGDTASYRKELAKYRASAAQAPVSLLRFDAGKDMGYFRPVIYHKGALALADLHARLGDEAFFQLLSATAAARVATTEAFLRLVERHTDRATRDWLVARLSS
ncbi:M1 family aminopeptidase [Hymenobacter chitinivorans]|uniref:Peptidase M1 membrane alanine aminopeptidase domain-containing protein n=1 Tax=Hymenobacter chitinivorans DSM 11115 TaxID=1121954 RepID=A0A2M9BMA5_9BACT|nr:M1 family aminopeptidase [Hymenobacter chitinivorans]PJJ59071.1 hypothetical protein CLV45_0484 [Hymenobacter chitinivorans DSM 11115]